MRPTHQSGYRSNIVAALVISLCSIAVPSASFGQPTDDAVIYATVLDSLFKHDVLAPRTLIVLLDSTAVYRREALVPEFWKHFQDTPGVDSGEVADLERRARFPMPLTPMLTRLQALSDWAVRLVSATALHELTRADTTADGRPKCCADVFWDAFYRAFPSAVGTVSLSPIGYDSTDAAAVLEIDFGCGALCGSGRIVALHRAAGTWRIVAVKQVWVS